MILWPVVAILGYLVVQILFHLLDMRIWSIDNDGVLRITFDLVDRGKPLLAGVPLGGEPELRHCGIYLGPLANLLMAIPAAVSANVYWQYYLLSILATAAAVLFWLAARRLHPTGPFAAVAAFAFAMQPMMFPYSVEPTFFLPFFLALLFLAVVRVVRGEPRWIPVMYGAFGLCLQMHLSVLFLFPALVLVTLGYRHQPRFGRLTALGFALLAATHLSVLIHFVWHFDAESFRAGLAYMTHGGKGGSIVRAFFHLIIFGPLWLGPVTYVFGCLGLVLAARLIRAFPADRLFLSSGYLATATYLVVLPPLLASKNLSLYYYLWPLGAYWALMAGEYFQYLYQAGRSRTVPAVTLGALAGLTVVGLLSFMPLCQRNATCDAFLGSFRLNDQIQIADRLARAIRANQLRDVEIHDVRFRQENGGLVRAWDNSETYDVLVGYRDPALKGMLAERGKTHLSVLTWPGSAESAPVGDFGRPLERWRRHSMESAIYLTQPGESTAGSEPE